MNKGRAAKIRKEVVAWAIESGLPDVAISRLYRRCKKYWVRYGEMPDVREEAVRMSVSSYHDQRPSIRRPKVKGRRRDGLSKMGTRGFLAAMAMLSESTRAAMRRGGAR